MIWLLNRIERFLVLGIQRRGFIYIGWRQSVVRLVR